MSLVPAGAGAATHVGPLAGARTAGSMLGRARTWAPAILLAVVAAAVLVLVVVPLPRYGQGTHPWLFFAAAYLVAGAAAIRVTVRSEIGAIGLAAIPLVIGVHEMRPTDLVLSQLVGLAFVLLVVRRVPTAEVVFGLAQAALATSLALVVFFALAPPAPGDVASHSLASFAAAGTLVIVTTLSGAAATWVITASIRLAPVGLGLGLLVAMAGTSLALLAVAIDEPDALWLGLALAVAATGANVAHRLQAERQARIEFLYDCARILQRSPLDTDALVELLARTRVMLGADVAEIVQTSAGVTYPAHLSVGRDNGRRSEDVTAADRLADRLAQLTPAGQGVVLGRRKGDRAHALVVPLRRAGVIVGTLMVADGNRERPPYTLEDLRLLETIAVHVDAALATTVLVNRLAESLANVTQLAAAVESSDDAILALTPEGAVSAWNHAAERMFGYPGAELAGLPATALLPPDQHDRATQAFGGIAAGDPQRRGASEMVRCDGSRVPVSVTLSPITDRSGGLAGMSAIVRDETDRTAADAALQESVERFRSVFRDSPLGMALADADLRWTAVNEALCRILERTGEELVGEHCHAFLHPDDADAAVRLADGLLADEAEPGYSSERRYLTGTGRIVWARVTVRRLMGDGTGSAQVVFMIEDVTESRLAAQRLRETEGRLHRAVAAFTAVREPASVLRAVLAAARDLLDAEFAAIGVLDDDGSAIADMHFDGIAAEAAGAICLAPSGHGLLGLANSHTGAVRVRDVRAHPRAVGIPPGHPTITSFLAVPIVFEGRLVARLYAGNKRGAPEFDADDEEVATALAAQAAVVLENARITARTLDLVGELDRTNADLRDANAAKSQFLGTVSHELRTPLHSVLVAAELVHDPRFGPLSERRARDLAATIHGSARHLLGLIDDLVDLSRIEARQIDIRPLAVPVARIIEEVTAELRPIALEKGVVLEHCADPDLVIHADPLRIRQVLLNLLVNAVKFSMAGGTARVEASRSAHGIEIAVRDTGPGIPEEDLERIFEPFQRLHGVQVPGAGLGLAIARQLVDLHGGTIRAASVVGRGSTFTISLPDPVPGVQAIADAEPVDDWDAVAARLGDTVLVVEDDATAIDLVSDVLTRAGYEVRQARTLGEAAERLAEQLPSLVLLDMRLGSEDGLELVRRLRTDPGTLRLPVLALSADAMRPDIERALQAGCDGHLAKPVVARELLRRIAALVSGSARVPEAAGGGLRRS